MYLGILKLRWFGTELKLKVSNVHTKNLEYSHQLFGGRPKEMEIEMVLVKANVEAETAGGANQGAVITSMPNSQLLDGCGHAVR